MGLAMGGDGINAFVWAFCGTVVAGLLLLAYMRFESAWFRLAYASLPPTGGLSASAMEGERIPGVRGAPDAIRLRVGGARTPKGRKAGHIRVLHISDVHVGQLGVGMGRINGAIRRADPDMIAFTGDYIEKAEECGRFIRFMGMVGFGGPIFLCMGNHDHKAFHGQARRQRGGSAASAASASPARPGAPAIPAGLGAILDGACEAACGDGGCEGMRGFAEGIARAKPNAAVLTNGTETLHYDVRSGGWAEGPGEGVCAVSVTGFDDLRAGKMDAAKGLASRDMGADVRLAMAHNPDAVLGLPEKAFDYILSGHFHAGQIWTPFHLEYRMLRRERLSKMNVRKGLFGFPAGLLYISAGIGCVKVPLRFLARPEISVLDVPLPEADPARLNRRP